MKTLILLVLLLPSMVARGQGAGLIQGFVADSATGQPLRDAAITLHYTSDSSFAGHAISGRNGEFALSVHRRGKYILRISCRGYRLQQQTMEAGPGIAAIRLGKILLAADFLTLSEAVVRTGPAVSVKGDTTSYRVEAFGLRAGASLEEGIKKMPGLEVQPDGRVRALGEIVQKLYVDGREFFSNDPAVALKNLSTDMVERVDVYDEGSEQARFTRTDDGQRTRVLNIRLRKDRNTGEFGRAALSAGTHNRYDAQGMLNHFSAVQRVSVTGSAGNTNKASYQPGNSAGGDAPVSFSNGNTMTGSGSTAGSGGINAHSSGGFSYTAQWGSRADISAGYVYTRNQNQLTRFGTKQYFLTADSVTSVRSGSEAGQTSRSHRVNARVLFTIDSMQSVLYTANLFIQGTEQFADDSAATLSGKTNPFLAATVKNQKSENREATGFGGELLYRRRFRAPGRTLVIGWRNNYSGHGAQGTLQNQVRLYTATGVPAPLPGTDQESRQDYHSGSNAVSIAYTHPLANNKLLELNYSQTAIRNRSGISVFDLDPATGRYDEYNHKLGNEFHHTQYSSRAGASFRGKKKIFNYQLGAALQRTSLAARSRQPQSGKDTLIRQRFLNVFPVAGIHFSLRKNSNLRLTYRGRNQLPSLSQLQDVTDNRDPLQLRSGNPGLKQEFVHSLDLQYNSYHTRSAVFFSTAVHLNAVSNKIVNSTDSVQTAVLLTRPVNQPGNYNGSGVVSLSMPFKKWKGTQLHFSGMAYLSRETSLLFKKRNAVLLLALDQSAGFSYRSDKVELAVRGNMVYQSLAYSSQPSGNTASFRTGWAATLQYAISGRFFGLTNFEQVSYTGRAAGFNQRVHIWNLALSRQFGKNNAAEIKFTAYDLLNQDRGISRLSGDYFVEDTRVQVIPRFFLLSFRYQFQRFSAGSKTPPAAPAKMQVFSN